MVSSNNAKHLNLLDNYFTEAGINFALPLCKEGFHMKAMIILIIGLGNISAVYASGKECASRASTSMHAKTNPPKSVSTATTETAGTR